MNNNTHKPEPHTVVRFKLRSLLAITSCVCLVMAMASPWLHVLDQHQWRHLYGLLGAAAVGFGLSVIYLVMKRRQLGMRCGKLLLTLHEQRPLWLSRYEWGSIFYVFAIAIGYLFFVRDPTNRDDIGIIFVPAVVLPSVCWSSTQLAKHCLSGLSEQGFGRCVELCEQGVVIRNRLLTWNAKTLGQCKWSDGGDQLVMHTNHRLTTVLVPPHQREAVEAILEHYYRPHHRTDDKDD